MSLGKIGRIIDAMRHERYRFQPGQAGLHPEEERECAMRRIVVSPVSGQR